MAATPDFPSEWGDSPHRTPTADDYLLADFDRRVARTPKQAGLAAVVRRPLFWIVTLGVPAGCGVAEWATPGPVSWSTVPIVLVGGWGVGFLWVWLLTWVGHRVGDR